MIRAYLRVILAIALGAVVVLITAYATLYATLYSEIKAFVAINAAQVFGLQPEIADYLAWIVAFVVAGFAIRHVIRHGWRLATGQLRFTEVVLILLGIFVVTAAIRFTMADWLFDGQGRAISYVCPATVPGEPPRLQFTATDHLLGGQCPPVNRKVAATLLSIRRGVVPQPVQINSLAEFEALEFFDRLSGLPIIFSGIPYPDGSERPRFFRGAGYDPAISGLLEPSTPETIKAAHAYFAEMDRRRNEENKKLAKETAEREARLEAQRQAEDKQRRAEAERQAAESARRATATKRERMTPQESNVSKPKPPPPATMTVTENDFLYTVKSCRRSGDSLSCSGSITNVNNRTRRVVRIDQPEVIDNEGAQYQLTAVSLGTKSGGNWSYADLEPNLPLNFTIDVRGASPTASSVSLILPNADAPRGTRRVTLRNIPVTGR